MEKWHQGTDGGVEWKKYGTEENEKDGTYYNWHIIRGRERRTAKNKKYINEHTHTYTHGGIVKVAVPTITIKKTE